MKKPSVKWAIAIYLLTIICVFTIGYGIAHAGYSSYRVRCETLVGKGYVMFYVDDDSYTVPIECK